MADIKLSALVELAATPAVDDEIYIRDISVAAADESKRILISNLMAAAVAVVEAAGLTFAENKGIVLNPVLSADGKWSGIMEVGLAGTNLVFGDLVYFAVADGKWEKTDADAVATAFAKLGIVVVAGNENNVVTVLLYGKIRADAAFPALTIGAPVHISTTLGDVQVAAPSGSGDIVRIIGYGNTANELFFCPDNTYVEVV